MDLALGARTLVMAIVNATDDSFSGDGVGDDLSRVRALGERALPSARPGWRPGCWKPCGSKA